MRLAKYVKQPREIKDYDIDYSPWLDPVEDTLDFVECLIYGITDPDEVSLENSHIVLSPKSVKLWFEGGEEGYRYKATVIATTVGGRVDEVELIFTVKDY